MGMNTSRQAFLRNFYRDKTTDWSVSTSDSGTATKIEAQTGFTLFIQRVCIYVETPAAQSYVLRSADDAVEVARVPANATTGSLLEFDYGEEGKPLTEGQGLEAAISGAGNGLEVHVEAYMRQTSPLQPHQL